MAIAKKTPKTQTTKQLKPTPSASGDGFDDGVSGDDDDGVSDEDVVSSEESGVSSDGEEVVDLAGCSRVVYEKRVGEHGVRFGVDGFGEDWTPVRRRRQKGKRDLEIGGGLRVNSALS